METISNHPFIEVSKEEIEQIQRYINIDDAKVQQNLDAIEDWVKKEKHLAEAYKYLDRKYLERLHIIEKGSVEQTKIRIDSLLTTRGMMSDMCLNVSFDEFDEYTKNVMFLPLPKLNPLDLTRVKITKLLNDKGNDFPLAMLYRYAFFTIDCTMDVDFNLGERHIVDLKYLNSSAYTKFNPIVLKKAEALSAKGYRFKVKGFHVVNAPPFVDHILTLVKKAIKEKSANRIYLHKSYEDLYKVIPREILPAEYGGDLKSSSILNEQWLSTLKTEEARKITEKTNKLYSDESKRSSYKFNTEYLGLPGSFSQLVVD